MKARLVEGTEVLVEGGKVMGRQTKEEGVRLSAEVIGHAFDSTLLLYSTMLSETSTANFFLRNSE